MKLLTTTIDEKITAENHLLEMTIGEYSAIAKNILHNNDLQRKRVKTSNRSYSLLKDDIKIGCVIPPIVLAIFPEEKIIQGSVEIITSENIVEKISSNESKLLILDGLQRTYTIFDLLSEESENKVLLEKITNLPVRIEVYSGISKVGVLYRMLTLNTGQTPMSTRHQVEMLYSDYKDGVDGLTFISEADNKVASGSKEYKFSDILDCFLSYITGDYLSIDREDLVSIIKNLETLTKEDKNKDVFKLLINSYNLFREKVNSISPDWQYDSEGKDLMKKAFSITVDQLFSKVQVMAGFGAALSFLIENELIKNLENVGEEINKINSNDISESLNGLIKYLDEIQVNAKKIGNEQRMYFYYFFRSILNVANEGHLDFEKSINQAYKFYKANTLR